MKLWSAVPFNLVALLLMASMLSMSSALPAHHRHMGEAEITNQTRHLLKLTQELLVSFARPSICDTCWH
ncbi:interleukin-11 [Arapaima gigas]